MTDRANPLPNEGMDHLDEMTCLLYLERQLDRARAQQVSQHVQDCAACRTLMRALERESRLLTRAMLEEEEPFPARLARFQERAKRSLQWIWGLAFALAATGLYALYTEFVLPWQTQLEQAGFGGSNLLSLLIFQGALWKGWQSMATLLEVLALLTVGIFAAALLRRRMRRGSALALVLAGLCAAVLLPGSATASEMRKGESVGVAKDEVINGDIFLFGQRVRVEGKVKGDVFVFCKEANISGHVEGDVVSFAQQLQVPGEIDGNIRAFTNTLDVRGTVGRNLLAFAETIDVDSGSKVGGSITSFVETITVEGGLGRDMLLFAKHLNLSGKVGGGIRMKGGELTINSGAEVDGPIRFDGEAPPEVSSSAKLASPVDFHKLEKKPRYMEGHYYVWRVIWTAAFILFGMVLTLLMPKFAEESVRAAELYAAPIGLGVLIFFGLPIAALIACVTVVGIPLGVLALGFWFLMLCSAELVVGTVVGSWIMGKSRDTWGLIGRMATGFVIVRIVYTVFAMVHVLSVLGALAIWWWGMGAISLALYRRLEQLFVPHVPSAPYAPPLPPGTPIGGAQPV